MVRPFPFSLGPSARALLVAGLVALTGSAAIGAATYVPLSDEALADGAPVIVEVTVVGAEPSPAEGYPSTDYLVQVERVLKGFVPGSSLVVRVVGGVRPDGTGLRVWGAPLFVGGQRALLFLVARNDGTYGVFQLRLGAFVGVAAGGTHLALPEGSAPVAAPPGEGRTARRERDFGAFAAWLAARAAGDDLSASYWVDLPAGLAEALDASLAAPSPPAAPLRWFGFDNGLEVVWHTERALRASLAAAVAAWTWDPRAPVRYGLAPAADRPRLDATAPDSVHAVLGSDPHEVLPGAFRCGPGAGGVLTLGAVWFRAGAREEFQGTFYTPIEEAEVFVNDGAGCLAPAGRLLEEALAHELGHTLGLDHACGDQGRPCGDGESAAALMAPRLREPHDSLLGSDDRRRLRERYGLTPARP